MGGKGNFGTQIISHLDFRKRSSCGVRQNGSPLMVPPEAAGRYTGQFGGTMIAGKVVGSLVSTRKSDKLVGNKFMIVEPLRHMSADTRQIIAIDVIGAGIGEYVMVAQGSAARIGCDMPDAPVDAAIVGIIDEGGIIEED